MAPCERAWKTEIETFVKVGIAFCQAMPFVKTNSVTTDNALSSALLSSGKALSSGQNPASQQFLFSKSSQ